MRVFVASDFHGSMKAFREAASKAEDVQADVVMLCGDITHFGSVQEARAMLSPLVNLRLPVLFVPGNCDPPSLTGVDIEGARCIHGLCETYGNLIFMGVGGGLTSPFQTPFEMTEEEIMDVLTRGYKEASGGRRLVLVSHHPPKDTKIDRLNTGKHIGSLSIKCFIEEKKPSIVFCGHVHEAREIDHIGETILVNPGPAKHGRCALVDFDGEIEVKLDYL